ncbi:MAG: mandelate racemase/muconate lactonizing enzyme family protein [Verrucomicrobia bacterium]|nr:mandelate racemase/muconate lactonizing enzyme family protein [Verrucomicrobiota bacterium]
MSFSRRDFLGKAAGLSALALADPVSLFAQEYPGASKDLVDIAAKPVLDLSSLKNPVIIESIDLLKKGNQFFVRVRSKDGVEGISLDNNRARYLAPIFLERVAPFFIGKDARQLENLLWELYRWGSNYKLQGLAYWSPVAWLEFAILDLLGRVAGKSMGDLLGGVIRKRIPFYVASGRRDSTPEEEIVYLQGLIDETKAKAVKYRVGGRMSRNEDALPNRTKELIPLTRKVLGDDIALHADSNSSYDPPQAIEVGRMLEDIGAVYFEEPCPFDRLEDTKLVTDTLTIPVSGGEQEYSHWRFQWAIQNRAVDIVQPDLHYYGGMIRSIRVSRMAELRNMPTTVHISGGFGFIYMLHFASRTPDIGRYQEYKRNIQNYSDWFDPPLRIIDGEMTVPEGPGVGIVDTKQVLKGAELVKA